MLQGPLYHFSPPESFRPKGIVHFLGGAFAGATPQLLYPGLIRALSKAGYAVISTPYAVTFRHLDCAQRVQQVCRRGTPPHQVASTSMCIETTFTACNALLAMYDALHCMLPFWCIRIACTEDSRVDLHSA